jgi:Bacterial PH domain
MMFRAKVDRFFITVISFAVGIVAAATLLPLILEDNVPTGAAVTMWGFFIVCTGFIVWISTDIKYVFNDDHLLVKGGPIKKRIAYGEITRVAPTRDIFTGFRILSSRDAIEVYYRTSWMGSVKVSPDRMDIFVEELSKRCPGLKVDGYQSRNA